MYRSLEKSAVAQPTKILSAFLSSSASMAWLKYLAAVFLPTSIDDWIDFLDAHSISHVSWNINDKEEIASALLPGADKNGEWGDYDLTFSGQLAHQLIVRYFA